MVNAEIDHYYQKFKRFLILESEAEKLEILGAIKQSTPDRSESSGISLVNLVIRSQDAGMGGKILITFGKKNQSLILPWTRLNIGTPVILSKESSSSRQPVWRGIIVKKHDSSIQVAFSDWPEPDEERCTYRLDRAADEISRQRQRYALDNMHRSNTGRLASLRDILLGYRTPTFNTINRLSNPDQNLNQSQIEAIEFALSAQDVSIIHGPPGTGKTTTLVELIRQITNAQQTVLAVAPSNLAIDNLLDKLIKKGIRAIRLGHPVRVMPELRDHTLDIQIEEHPDMALAQKWVREAYSLRHQAARFTRARPQPGARQALRLEANHLLADARQLENQLIDRLMDASQVVCATMTGLDKDLLYGRRYDWCIVDEASQSTEPAVWIPLQYCSKLVLAGDPCQLPPTVISPQASAEGFNISMMERLMSEYGPSVSRRLLVQYRMHHEIMTFSSNEFYDHQLIADPSVAYHLLVDLPGVKIMEKTNTPIHFFDTAGAGYDEETEPDNESRLNRLEADLVLKQIEELVEAGLSTVDIAVITPYSAQVKLLREKIMVEGVEVDSIDGFQGREKEAVIVTLVRSNNNHEIGFLADTRRMNVALTRARRKLIVIGDSATITIHPFYQKLVNYFDGIDAYHSIWEYH